MKLKLSNMLKSRRFWVAVSSVFVVIMNEMLGLDADTASKIATVGIAWIVGDSLRITE
tara:strand:- start:4701 stop:4874 length:174 start_codon:yes stop_codon:yes gene_type:complete